MPADESAAPCVVIHGLADADAALGPGRLVTLLSGPGAALYAGVPWWRALIAAGAARHPATPAADILDCDDAAGAALAALAAGCRAVVLRADTPAAAAVRAAAASQGAIVLDARPPALDLADPAARRRLDAWLATP